MDELKVDTQMSKEDLEVFLASQIDKAVEKYGIDKIDIKHAKLPGANDVNVTGLSEVDARQAIMKNFIKQTINKAAYAEGADATGRSLVPVEFIDKVATLLKDYGMFRKYATNFNMKSATATMTRTTGQASGSFINEASNKPISNNTYEPITFTRHTYAFGSLASREIIQDSGIDLFSHLAELAANDFARAEDLAGFLGSGSPITGINSATGVNPVVLTGTLAASLTYQKILDLAYAVPTNVARDAAFYMHRSVWAAIAGLEDTGDTLIWNPNFSSKEPNIQGYPVRLTESMNSTSVTAVDTPYIIFGDLKNAWLGQREGFRMDAFDQYYGGVDLARTNQIALRFEEAFDIQVVLPGAFSVLRSVGA